MCVRIMGMYQQARFELQTFPDCDIDRGLSALSLQQNKHKISKF